MESINKRYGKWEVSCIPEDGARISLLRYNNFNLLTGPPSLFRPPIKDYGEYELRPVYGYDDCFPSITPCKHPNMNLFHKDHGDLCWQNWQVETHKNHLLCCTDLYKGKIRFMRKMIFNDKSLIWEFNIFNQGEETFDFLHVVHPLMPLNEIAGMEFPLFEGIMKEGHFRKLKIKTIDGLNDHLLNVRNGDYEMLFVGKIKDGVLAINYRNKLKLQLAWDKDQFPTLGIWWNNCGYPEEEGLQRSECAFEPIPGINSDLEFCYKNGQFLSVIPKDTYNWKFLWKIIDE